MIMRITWGRLYPGTWDEFERMYRSLLAGKAIQGLRGRWLVQDVNDPDCGFAVMGRRWKTCGRMSKATRIDLYVPTLRPFFAGEYTTYRCDVKYSQ